MIDHDSHDIDLKEPIRLRVWDKMSDESIIHWNDDHCDPYWDVELLEPHDELDKASSVWIDGISRSVDGKVEHPGWKIDESQRLSHYYVERQCMADYEKHAGKFLLAHMVKGHIADNNEDFLFDLPVRVRVIEDQRESDIIEWTESEDSAFCRPYWDVELAEDPFDTETCLADDADRLWVDGIHRSVTGHVHECAEWALDPNQAPITEDAARDMPAVLTTCPHCGQQLLLAIKKATTSSTS